LLKKKLTKEGFNVKLTREKDVFIELSQRANLANKWDGDLFISLHCNAVDGIERQKRTEGYHFYVLRAPESEEDKAIARRENKVASLYGDKEAKEELSPLEWFKLEARLEKYKQNSYMYTEELLNSFNNNGKIKQLGTGVGGAGFMVLVGALMPAVLVELGFITHPKDEKTVIKDLSFKLLSPANDSWAKESFEMAKSSSQMLGPIWNGKFEKKIIVASATPLTKKKIKALQKKMNKK
jgi:N-acetylmuramoyl-L-alanine amidase